MARLLIGMLQIIAGVSRDGTLMTGFINKLAILIFMAQFPKSKGAG